MIKLAVWLFAGAGALICILGGALIFASQATTGSGHIFPLPGLILIDWASTGILGFISTIALFDPQYHKLGKGVWIMTGALLPLMVLGALSIGPLVLIAMLCFLMASILSALYSKTQLLPDLGYLFIGLIGNLVIVLGLILIASLVDRTV